MWQRKSPHTKDPAMAMSRADMLGNRMSLPTRDAGMPLGASIFVRPADKPAPVSVQEPQSQDNTTTVIDGSFNSLPSPNPAPLIHAIGHLRLEASGLPLTNVLGPQLHANVRPRIPPPSACQLPPSEANTLQGPAMTSTESAFTGQFPISATWHGRSDA
jgi:hypothetical protein